VRIGERNDIRVGLAWGEVADWWAAMARRPRWLRSGERVPLVGLVGLVGLTRNVYEKNYVFLYSFSNELRSGNKIQKKYLAVPVKYETFSGYRLGHLTQLWLLTL
jgi:hypothetical protein